MVNRLVKSLIVGGVAILGVAIIGPILSGFGTFFAAPLGGFSTLTLGNALGAGIGAGLGEMWVMRMKF